MCRCDSEKTVSIGRLPVHAAGSASRSRAVPAAQVGDLLAIFQSSAYGLSASPTAFLGHPQPVEVLVRRNGL
jgi:diaminopimelate decarboxylase